MRDGIRSIKIRKQNAKKNEMRQNGGKKEEQNDGTIDKRFDTAVSQVE